MIQTIIAASALFTLTSHGHGLAYSLDRKADRYSEAMTVFVQGDDAEALEDEWEAIEAAHPNDRRSVNLDRLFLIYSCAAEPSSLCFA